MVGAIVRSLSLRLLLPILGIVCAVLGIYAAVTLYAFRQHFTELAAAEARRSTDLVVHALHHRMLQGAQLDLQQAIEALTAGGSITSVRLYTTDGHVAHSNRAAEVGAAVQPSASACIQCHRTPNGPPPAEQQRDIVRVAQTGSSLRHLEVIPNQPECRGCHRGAGEKAILGVLDLELAMSPLDEALREANRLTLGTLLGLLLVTTLASTIAVGRLVHRPVRQLYEGMQLIAHGDLDACIEVSGRHELAELAGTFNRMARDLKVARQEINRYSQRLEESVVAKSDELRRAQHQVLHTERMASLGKLAATVAHELNNPLSGILSCAKLAERELGSHELPPAARAEIEENLHLVERECSRCGSIVKNLLLFARHVTDGEMATVDVAQVVERSLMLVRHRLEISSIKLERRIPPGDFTITAHAGQLEQALVALLVNAVEAMEEDGDGVLTVGLAAVDGQLEITIADTGVGIHPDVLPHIFEPFFSTKNVESGVGLGLAIVYGIVQRHGGTIDVQSAAGQGTTFRLRLPSRQPLDRSEERQP